MTKDIVNEEAVPLAGSDWFDPPGSGSPATDPIVYRENAGYGVGSRSVCACAWGVGLPERSLLIVDGVPRLEKALVALWPDLPIQRGTVHKHRSLLAHAPKKMHDEIHRHDLRRDRAGGRHQAQGRSCASGASNAAPVTDSLEEAGEKLFTFLRFPPEQWRSIRTTNAIERRRTKTQCLLPCAATACVLFWALMARVKSRCARSTAAKPSRRPC